MSSCLQAKCISPTSTRCCSFQFACRICFLALALIVVEAVTGCRKHTQITLTVSVAASLEGTIEPVEVAYRAEHPDVVFRNNFGSSGTLAREIENGAPVDAFLSAAEGPMNNLARQNLLAEGSRLDVLQNSLVLIAPQNSKLSSFEDLTGRNVKLIALGDPASVPAGQYGKAVLDALGLYDKIKPKLVLGKDVRQVLTYVQTGNADAGLVYATDARSTSLVRSVAVAPAGTHKPIVYPAAAIASSQHGATTRAFVQFLASPQAKAIFTQHGFTIASS
ncbi:MAG TPA: molybdate ABC transporter substrate-binding protein [Terracidiphilus sp.]|nr:molybdate ABC transporter substrate-binding protein [Terracidiphilus sp.]